MRSLGVLVAILAVAACSGDSVTGPDAARHDPHSGHGNHNSINASVRPYKVAFGQPAASTSKIRADVVQAQGDNGVVEENWGPDSIVYQVNASGIVSLSLFAQARDLTKPDSAVIPNVAIQWNVVTTAYSHDPKLDDKSLGLDSVTTTTDQSGNTMNTFTFDADSAVFHQTYGGYFYIDISTFDSKNNVIKQGRFYIFMYQQPTWIAYWDGKFASFDTLTATAPNVQGVVTIDVSQHVSFPVVEGADSLLGHLNIDHVVASGCTVQGTVVSCSVDVLPVEVDVYPDINNPPAGVTFTGLQADPSSHTFFQLNAAP